VNNCIAILLFLLLSLSVIGQDDYDGEGCAECDLSCITCLPFTTIIDSTATTVAGDAQNIFCTFVEHQISWYGFIAGSVDLELTITVDSCEGLSQVEIGIFQAIDCLDPEGVSNCYGGLNFNAIGNGSTEVVNTDVPLVIGQYYWIITDATSNMGAHCYFTLEVTDGITGATPIVDIPIITGPTLLCDNESGVYSISNEVTGASEYDWYVYGSLEFTGEQFDFTPATLGVYEICAAGISYCGSGPLSNPCFEVTVSESTLGDIALVFCNNDCLDYLGTNYCAGGNYQDISLNAAGCDSIIDITIHQIEIDIDILALGDCINGLGVELVLNPMVNADLPLDGSEIINWDWYYEGALINGTTNMLSIFGDLSGAYSVNYTLEYLGVTCSEEESFDLPLDDYGYNFNTVEDYGDVCNLDIVTYELLFTPYDPADFTVMWSVPPDAFIVSGQGSSLIEVDWTGIGGQVCYTVSNFCAVSPEVCFNVNVLGSSPPEIILDTLIVCINEIITVSAFNIPATYDAFMWDFSPGVTLVSGSLEQPTDIEVFWSSIGMQNIQLFLDDGCNSYNVVATIEVIENPTFPAYTCLVEGTNLTIDWNDIPNISSYTVNNVMGGSGILNGSSYQILDVNPGEMIQIEVIGDGLCGPVSTMMICIIPDCPTTDLELQNNLPDTLCINSTPSIYTLEGMDNAGNIGLEYYNGPGILDSINGTFDIIAAGPGLHILSYTLELNNGDCISKAFDTIFIFEEPILNLSIDQNIVCSGDTTLLVVEGYSSEYTIESFFDNPSLVLENEPGSFALGWEEPGVKNISIEITDPFCGTYTYDISVSVQNPPSLELICLLQSTNGITISWVTDTLYSSYDIVLNGTYEETVTSPPYTIDNLPVDSTVLFTVLPSSNTTACLLTAESISCSTIDCPPVILDIISPIDTIICTNAESIPAQLILEYDTSLFDGTETIIWSGVGVSTGGLVNPENLTGNSLITAILSFEDCIYNSTIQFILETPPILSLDFIDEICLGDSWNLLYDGEIDMDYIFLWETNASISLSDLGPFDINFETTGEYFFTLNASNQCSSIPVTATVMVRDSARTPQVDCFAGVDFINLMWTVDPSECNGDFTVLIDGQIVITNFNGNELFIEDLDLETTYQIEIINNSSCICPSISTIINCSTIPCFGNLLSINSSDSIYCLDPFSEDIILTGLFDDGELSNGLTWSGDGINQNGSIDLSLVGEGIQTYELLYIDANMCSFSTSIELDFISLPSFEYLLLPPPCVSNNSGSLILTSDPIDNFEYLIDDNIIDPTLTINLSTGTHTITVINQERCGTTESFTILPGIDYTATIEGLSIIPFGESSSYSYGIEPDVLIDSITWILNDSIIETNNDIVVISEPGLLCADLQFHTDCHVLACLNIELTNPNVYIPNIITQEKNSQNHHFTIFSNDPKALAEYLTIYDRWGNVMYNQQNKLLTDPSMLWEGSFKGEKLNPGIFVFRLNVLFSNGQEELFTGNITLIK